MAKKPKSPRLVTEISPEYWDRAKQASSGGCLIADAIRRQHPHLSNVKVDMATIAATDRKRGERYTWLTPDSAQTLLLSYDQGWAQPTEHQVRLNGAVRIQQVRVSSKAAKRDRQLRLDELETKVAAGQEMTRAERASLTRLRGLPTDPPTTEGPVEAIAGDGPDTETTLIGGRKKLPKVTNPNLLVGRNRVFGARLAKPSEPFQQAVEAEVAARLAIHAS